ncbi:hypothetical protein [Paenibacillus sp. GCM10027626]|uniref:hypothetical protein n=1 Tax=Paenibacillus sp. GCM10027626 TaxID=3273411 RepID=UPI003626BC54
MQDERVLKFIDTRSKDYSRVYANSTLLTISPHNDVVIDFCEETLQPFLITEQILGGNINEVLKYSHDPREVIVEREKKFSVTMNKERALQMAHWIFQNCREDGAK